MTEQFAARFNINDYICFRLTEAGEAAWNSEWSMSHPAGVPEIIRQSATLPDGRIRMQLWEAMNTFGPSCFNGSNSLPFVKNEIFFESRYEELEAASKSTESAAVAYERGWQECRGEAASLVSMRFEDEKISDYIRMKLFEAPEYAPPVVEEDAPKET